jgi:hypothetical protein
MTRRPTSHRSAFTFVEVICILLVVIMGIMGAIGLAAYGMKISHRAQGQSTGLATAISVAMDAQPLLDPALQGTWVYTPYPNGLTDHNPAGITCTSSGFINGYYVQRTEKSALTDIIAEDAAGPDSPGPTVYARSAQVDVDVWDTFKGSVVASYTTRIIRQRRAP